MTDSHGVSPDRDDQHLSPGDVLGERYELLDRIGSGASANTWRATDTRLQRTVAVKVLRRSYATDPTFAQRFEREARTAASVSHPNVVDVYDVGRDGGELYLVMQYVQGEDLKQLIQRTGPLGTERSRDIATQVLTGLQAIHAAGIIHRDIKPQNVLIGRDGVARVTDFGVAQVAVDVGLTTVGTTVGTASYMAPEQARAETLSQATDLYAVGVMLYEMLTGQLPFTGPTHMAIMLAHIEQEAAPPSSANPGADIPPAFDGIVMQAMAKSPQDRFRTAQAMSRALANAPLTGGEGTRTVQVASAPSSRTQRPSSGAWPTPSPQPRQSEDLEWARRSAAGQSASGGGSGVRAALWGFLILVIVALAAIGLYAYNEYVADDDDPDPTNTPAVTQEATEEDEEPTATEEDEVVPPIEPEDTEEPTNEPEPTDEPTDEPQPTDEPEPTDEPTEEDVPTIGPQDPETPVIIGPDATETPAG